MQIICNNFIIFAAEMMKKASNTRSVGRKNSSAKSARKSGRRHKRLSPARKALRIVAIAFVALVLFIIMGIVLLWSKELLPTGPEELPRYKARIAAYFVRLKDASLPEGEVIGIDVSHYQAAIDFEELTFHVDSARKMYLRPSSKTTPRSVDFVVAKASQGAHMRDAYYADNQAAAHEHGVVFGAYHFYSVQADAKAQAENYIHAANLQKGDMVPVLDVEPYKNRLPAHEDVLLWLKIVEEYYGATPVIYTGENCYKSFFRKHREFQKYNFWIARYGGSEPSMHHLLWQCTDNGKVGGITGPTDVDVFRGSMRDLKSKYCIK